MDDKTLKALKASIRKWDKNAVAVRRTQYKTDTKDCPLCAIFNAVHTDHDDRCKGCPVYLKTGEQYCARTPFGEAEYFGMEWDDFGVVYRSDAQEAARDEAAFLRSLLPDGETA